MRHWKDIFGPVSKTEHRPPIPPIPPKLPSEPISGGTGGIGGLRSSFVFLDAAAFDDRAATLQFDAGLPREEAEDRAAQEVGLFDAGQYRTALSSQWKALLRQLYGSGPDRSGREYVQTAITFVEEGWAEKCALLGWTETELFWADENAPWARLDNIGAAYLARNVISVTDNTIVCGVHAGRPLVIRRGRGDGRVAPPWQMMGASDDS